MLLPTSVSGRGVALTVGDCFTHRMVHPVRPVRYHCTLRLRLFNAFRALVARYGVLDVSSRNNKFRPTAFMAAKLCRHVCSFDLGRWRTSRFNSVTNPPTATKQGSAFCSMNHLFRHVGCTVCHTGWLFDFSKRL